MLTAQGSSRTRQQPANCYGGDQERRVARGGSNGGGAGAPCTGDADQAAHGAGGAPFAGDDEPLELDKLGSAAPARPPPPSDQPPPSASSAT